MPFDAVELQVRDDTRRGLREKYGPLVVSASESLEGAVWLLSGYRIPQALAMFHNTVELLFKAELARIHLALIADARQLKFEDLKALFREQVRSHPRGAGMHVPEFDIERTIVFSEAMKRVKEFYPGMIANWERTLVNLNELRNDVIHYGGDKDATGDYLSSIFLSAIPFIREFLKEAYDTDFGDLVLDGVARELEVASDTTRQLEQEGQPLKTYVMNTVSWLLRYYWSMTPESESVDGDWLSVDEPFREKAKRDFEEAGNHVDAEEMCQICGAYYVLVSYDIHDAQTKEVRAVAMRCFRCGLKISPEQRHLAHFHHGPVAAEKAQGFLKAIGEA